MKLNTVSVSAIAITALFLSAQAFAWGGSPKTDKDVGYTDMNGSSMSNRGPSTSPADRDMNGNQSDLNSNQPAGKYKTISPGDVMPTP